MLFYLKEEMMVEIVSKQILAEGIVLFGFLLPQIAQKAKPGQFVIIRVEEEGERIPLTIADWDLARGIVMVAVQVVGETTYRLSQKDVGEGIAGVAGPLGKPTQMQRIGTVICIGGGVGVACLYPLARGYKEQGNRVISLIGAKTSKAVIFKERLQKVSDLLLITTEDGSLGKKGVVSDLLLPLLEKEGKRIDLISTLGPARMMSAVAEITRPLGIPTYASLNPIMLDGTGMCGGCRVTVDRKVRFACIDGPEFDAHKVDFAELIARQGVYKTEERCRLKVLGLLGKIGEFKENGRRYSSNYA